MQKLQLATSLLLEFFEVPWTQIGFL